MASTTARTCPFSQEIVDLIIDYLRADRFSLAACGRVCLAWLPRSRHHLFYAVDMRPMPRFTLEELGCSITSYRISQFVALAKSPHCTFLPYIQKVDCVYSIHPREAWNEVFNVLRLDRVHSARMWYTDREQNEVPTYTLEPFQAAFANVTTLEIIYLIFDDGNQVMAFLGGFTSLETLRFAPRDIGESDEYHGGQWKLSPQLRTLALGLPGPLCRWISECAVTSIIELNMLFDLEPEDVRHLIQASCFTRLQSFKMQPVLAPCPKPGETVDWFEIYTLIPWASFQNIQVLTLTELRQELADNSVFFFILSSFLHPICILNLEFQFWNHDVPDELNTAALKRSLGGPAYRNCRVNFQVLNQSFSWWSKPDQQQIATTYAHLQESLRPEVTNLGFEELTDWDTYETDTESILWVGWSTERWEDTMLGGTADPREGR